MPRGCGARCSPSRWARAASGAAVVAAIAGALASGDAGAQGTPDCALLARPSQASQPSYAARLDPPRCEGFFERNVAQSFLELVSVTRTPLRDAAAQATGRWVVRGHPHADASLTIQPLRSTPLYRVDALLRRGESFEWDAKPMLEATRLRARDLGLLARVATPVGATPVWAPVVIGSADKDAPAHAVLRPSVGVSAMSWRTYRPGQEPGPWQPIAGVPLFAWERVTLVVAPAGDGRAQHVDVRALDTQGQTLPLLSFVILGVNDGTP